MNTLQFQRVDVYEQLPGKWQATVGGRNLRICAAVVDKLWPAVSTHDQMKMSWSFTENPHWSMLTLGDHRIVFIDDWPDFQVNGTTWNFLTETLGLSTDDAIYLTAEPVTENPNE